VVPPKINFTAGLLAPWVQTPSLLRQVPDQNALLGKNAGTQLPLPWLSGDPPTKNRGHLTLDEIPYSMLFLLGSDGVAALPVTSQHLEAHSYREPQGGRKHPQLRGHCRNLLMEEWKARGPALARYPFPPWVTQHPFMGLNKFGAGRLHQIRSGKTSLRGHRSWDNDNPTTCRRRTESPGPVEHAILSCPTREPARIRHLQARSDLGHDALVWYSAAVLCAQSRIIRSTRTPFSPDMFSHPTSSASSSC